MAKLRPLGNHLIVKPLSAHELSRAGILLPDSASKEKPEKGEVIAAGPGKILDNGSVSPMHVKVGDKIIFKKYSPDEIKMDSEEYLVLSESDVLAVME